MICVWFCTYCKALKCLNIRKEWLYLVRRMPNGFWTIKESNHIHTSIIPSHQLWPMLVVMAAITEWHHYLLNTYLPFQILTDHKNLKYFHKPQDLSWQQAHWNRLLQEYHSSIEYCPGGGNLADPLSRRSDFEKGVDVNNLSIILLSDNLFTINNLTFDLLFLLFLHLLQILL